MIEVKAFYSGWHEVNKDQAQRFVSHLISGMVSVKGDENKVKLVEQEYLRGITVKELFGDK